MTNIPVSVTPASSETLLRSTQKAETAVVLPTLTPLVQSSPQVPWLVYLRSSETSEGGLMEEFAILDRDSYTVTPIKPDWDVNAFFMTKTTGTSCLISMNSNLYLLRPMSKTMLTVQSWYHTEPFSGNKDGGLLATTYQPNADTPPELLIYEIPSGKVRSRFPLVQCPEQAEHCKDNAVMFSDIASQRFSWSPNGRYLAFAAVQNTTSSDLYVYDKEDGGLRQLTFGLDWVGEYWWSPNGDQIIFQEIAPWDHELKQEDYFYVNRQPTSLWSASVSNSRVLLLHQWDRTDWFSYPAYPEIHLMMWLDNERFLTNGGDSFEQLGDAAPLGENILWIDTVSGESRTILKGSFIYQSLDEVHNVLALYVYDTPQDLEQGVYLVSIETAAINYIEGHSYSPTWDEKTGLFMTDEPCLDNRNGYQAYDYRGNLTCFVKLEHPTASPKSPTATAKAPSFSASNEKWTVFLRDGVWLKDKGNTKVQVSTQSADWVTWCPDSSCFFFTVPVEYNREDLYRVSLSDLQVTKVDEAIQGDDYQWVGGQ